MDGRFVYIFKITDRTNGVKHVRVAFSSASVPLASVFWDELRRRMILHAQRHGGFNRTVVGARANWLITCTFAWPESLIDKLMNETAAATQAGTLIDASMDLADVWTDLDTLLDKINKRQPPNN